MITRLTQDLQAGDTYNMSQIGYEPMTITKVTRLNKQFVRLDGTRNSDNAACVCTVLADIEVFQEV